MFHIIGSLFLFYHFNYKDLRILQGNWSASRKDLVLFLLFHGCQTVELLQHSNVIMWSLKEKLYDAYN